MTRRWLILLVLLLPVIAACSDPTNAEGPAPQELLPAGFPVPDGAQTVTLPGGVTTSVVTLRVAQPSDDVVAFYAEALPANGWDIEPWEGTGPNGDPTSGFVVERGDEQGALSVTAADGDAAVVQINMNQPSQPTEAGPGGMPGGMHGGADAPPSPP